MSTETPRKRGRPKGYVMSEESKDKIRKTRAGYTHTIETKDKISAGVLKYFDKLHPISDEMLRYYTNIGVDEKVLKFLEDNKEEIDKFDDVKTERKLRSIQYYEDVLWDDTAEGDTITPQLLLLLKEELEEEK
jgi:hypothetical protein